MLKINRFALNELSLRPLISLIPHTSNLFPLHSRACARLRVCGQRREAVNHLVGFSFPLHLAAGREREREHSSNEQFLMKRIPRRNEGGNDSHERRRQKVPFSFFFTGPKRIRSERLLLPPLMLSRRLFSRESSLIWRIRSQPKRGDDDGGGKGEKGSPEDRSSRSKLCGNNIWLGREREIFALKEEIRLSEREEQRADLCGSENL